MPLSRNGSLIPLTGATVGAAAGAALERMVGVAFPRGDSLMPVIVLPTILFGVYAGAAVAGAIDGCSDYGLFIGGFAGFFLGLILGQMFAGALLLPVLGAATGVFLAKLIFPPKDKKTA